METREKEDNPHSPLDAIQNRSESIISNLSSTVTNLLQFVAVLKMDDYVVEMSNMTRLEALQQVE